MVRKRARIIHTGSSSARYYGAYRWADACERMAGHRDWTVEVDEEGLSKVDGSC
jgi:hypothetical protein